MTPLLDDSFVFFVWQPLSDVFRSSLVPRIVIDVLLVSPFLRWHLIPEQAIVHPNNLVAALTFVFSKIQYHNVWCYMLVYSLFNSFELKNGKFVLYPYPYSVKSNQTPLLASSWFLLFAPFNFMAYSFRSVWAFFLGKNFIDLKYLSWCYFLILIWNRLRLL